MDFNMIFVCVCVQYILYFNIFCLISVPKTL